MAEIETYTPQQVRDNLKRLVGKSFIVEGNPTGLYADRSSYGNRPTLAIILDGVLPCQGYCQKVSDRFFAPETRRLIDRGLRESLGLPEQSELDWKSFPEWNNEYLAVASSCIDDCLRNQRKVSLVGTLRDDSIFEFYGLKTPTYRFVLEHQES